MSSTTVNEVIRERPEATNQVLEYADNSRKAGVHTDVCLIAGTKHLRAHRLILSCYSVYFRTMFQTEMTEKYADVVKIEGVNATSLDMLIDFIYTGKICINHQNVFDLLAASDYLQINETKQFCFDFMFNLISVETCFSVLKMADLYQNSDLLNKTFQFISSHFEEISTKTNFKCQSKENILSLLSQLNPTCVDERSVYDAMIEWVKHNENCRGDFAELFQRLDLSKLSSSFLAEIVSTETLIIENHLCSNLVMTTFAMKFKERAFNNPSKILSLGGTETTNKVFVVYNNDQAVYPLLPQALFGQCSVKVDNFDYCIGGGGRFSPANKVWKLKLDEANVKWKEVTSMEVRRSNLGALLYKNGIVVAGGWSSDAGKSFEFYNPSLNRWSALPSINKSRCYHALVTCNDRLFCLGGCADDRFLSSAEMLSDLNGAWQHVQSMQMPRGEFAAVSCMNIVYAIGGRNIQNVSMNSVEKYDPKSNEWMLIKEMNIKRRGHAACVMQNKIYVIGGIKTNNGFVSEIECYDPLSNSWSIVGHTSEELVYHSVFAI